LGSFKIWGTFGIKNWRILRILQVLILIPIEASHLRIKIPRIHNSWDLAILMKLGSRYRSSLATWAPFYLIINKSSKVS
jgi:hypothetical protein